MKLVLFGAGAMGRLVTRRANDDGDQVTLVLTSRDQGRPPNELVELIRGNDAAIDFSVAGAVVGNVTACARAGLPLVEGTTGWQKDEAQVREIVAEHAGALIYGANFSVGVNLFYGIVERAAALCARFPEYVPFIEEAHHARKRDAPSGTALRLRDRLAAQGLDAPVTSTRAGHIPGTHRVGFDSPADQITLTHTARSREGFAAGALVAARWIQGRPGTHEFSKMIDEMLDQRDK